MKVQTKISLLILALLAAFLAGLWAFRTYDRQRFRRIAEDRFSERNRSFEEFLAYHGQPLKTLAIDYTSWDQMVEAIARNDQEWFAENVNVSTLDSFRTNAIWIFRPDGTLAYQLDNLGAEDLQELPVPRDAFNHLFRPEPFCHFFLKVRQGIMEIRGATVHSSKDVQRKAPPSGYFFAGRLWSKPALDEMAMYTGNEIAVVSPQRAGESYNDDQNGLIVFSRPLRSWDGTPVAQMVVRNESQIVRELNRSSMRLLLSLILFSLILLLLIIGSLPRWVSRPLRQIMESLKRNDPAPIERLSLANSEFGELARTVQKFYMQRDNLLREMEERRATEEALRKSEEELRHSQKMEAVGRLAGGIAHDFNNLLTAIIGYAELITGRDAADPAVRQHAALIQKAGEQAAGLTKQLLAFSRKQLLQPRVIDLNHLVVEMEKLLRRVIGEQFHLETLPEAEIGTVMADPSQIEQVILNLGVNARDAMPSGGTLVIRTANVHLTHAEARQISTSLGSGEYVELSVADTGLGMDEETKAHIFEPFFTTKGPGKGTGLGLATVYGIVRQTGGGISVETCPGNGSTFRIYLPLERAPVDLAKSPAGEVEKSQNFETVMVVEDEQIVRELVCDVLMEQGYQVLCAADGRQALKMAADYDGQIHLLVTDVIMPQMNGHEVAAQLLHQRPDLKVLYISGYSDNDLGDHGVLDPDVDLLQKPFTPQTLAQRIREVIHGERYVTQTR